MKKNKIDIFEKYPVSKAVLTLALPTILGMLVNVFYNMVDTFFVGKTGDPNQVAAVSLTMPIFLLLMAFGNIFGIGGASYISRKLGEKNYNEAKKTSSFCFYGSILIGIISMFLFLIFINGILKISGASANTYSFSKDYLRIIALGAPFICCQQAMGQIIRSEGASREAMFGMMLGTVVNIILDPIMILTMNMGVAGAAWATIIGNIFSTVYYILYFLRKNTVLSISYKLISFDYLMIKNIFIIGIPVSINNILMSASNILINNFASGYGDNVLAGLGISQRIFTLAIMLFIGLSQGLQPFVGYNYASRNYKRMNKAIKFSIVISVISGSVLALLGILFSGEFIKIFIDNEEVMKYGKMFMITSFSVAPILGMQFIFMSTFQAIGKAIPSLILSLSRQGIAFVPTIIIGTKLFGLSGLIWSQPIADIASVVLSAVLYIYIYNKMKQKADNEIKEHADIINKKLSTEEI